MKTLKKLLIVVFCMGLCFACSEPDVLLDDTPELQKAKNAKQKSGKTKVIPSTAADALTKAQEDWQNINEALQNAGSGEVVQLAKGLFYLHKSIVRWDFNGTLKGSGMNETTIQTAPGMDFDIENCPPINWSFEDNGGNGGAFMLCFAHDYFENERTVSVSNLSIIVDEPTPVRPNKNRNSLHAIMVINVDLDNERDKPVDLNVSYKNLSVTGEKDPKYLYEGYIFCFICVWVLKRYIRSKKCIC